MDLLAHTDDAFLREHLTGEKGGMVLVDDADIAALVGRLAPAPVAAVPGGAAANTAVAAAKLGLRTSFLGKVGSDATAAQYLAHFREHGGDTSRLKHAPLPNARCLSLVTPDGQRTMRTHLGAAMTLAPEEVSPEDFAGVRHAHIEGYLLFNPALADKVVQSARAAGCTLSIDLASFEVVAAARDWIFAQLEQGVDILFANEDEARTLFQRDEPYENYARALARFGGIAAVKIGAEGAWLARGDALHRIAPIPVAQVVDTTGAGDAWAGGFLYAHLRGAPLSDAGALGSLLGSQSVQHLGAAIPAAYWPQLRTAAAELLARHIRS
ncbi:ribokinase [Cephaloticoccus primus]|uniref:Ribokinase n=2 Tax=Cephaloticoccus primus TaxID=1548207 RepID=A0A139SIY3_9BACT|nr:ribokinase [Cephaloticoccus primus]